MFALKKGGMFVPSADIFRTREVFQMRTSTLYGAKIFGFFEIYGVSAWTRGIEPVRTRGFIFRDFMRTSFMEGLLQISH